MNRLNRRWSPDHLWRRAGERGANEQANTLRARAAEHLAAAPLRVLGGMAMAAPATAIHNTAPVVSAVVYVAAGVVTFNGVTRFFDAGAHLSDAQMVEVDPEYAEKLARHDGEPEQLL